MMRQAEKISLVLLAFLLVMGGQAGPARAAGETMYDYTKIPAFLEVGLNPNLLLLIDNSASMYDPAYRNPLGPNYCYARGDEDLNGDGVFTLATEDGNGNGVYDKNYVKTVAYAGNFDPADSSWYVLMHPSMPGYLDRHQFVQKPAGDAQTWCTGKGGTIYSNSELCLTVNTALNPNVVLAFAAKGRFLNWLMASKFDVEKKVLTGGKYNNWSMQSIMETRGCDSKSFIKDIPVKNGAANFVASFGVRPPTTAEKAADAAFYPASITNPPPQSNTRLDFYKVTTAGMLFADCRAAIEAFAAGNLGAVKSATTACLGTALPELVASQNAFNHIMQECWYYNKHGVFQPGGGTVTTMKNDCEKVYNTTPGEAPEVGYVRPESLSGSDICYGQYDPAHPVGGPWGVGYVGQCWEPQSAAFTWVDRACDPAVNPTTNANPFCNTSAAVGTVNVWYVCDGSYNAAQHKCVGSPGVWKKVRDAVPGLGGITSVDWTNDDPVLDASKSLGYTCVESSLRKYCQNLDEPTTIDPSDYTDPQGSAWGLPALLTNSAAQSQLGNPLVSTVGRIYAPTAPRGLVQEFKYNLRLGLMHFNDGTKSECRPIQSPAGSGRYIASLYDCLADKGADIKATSLPEAGKLNGGKIKTYIAEGDSHNVTLVNEINKIEATTWTPTAEALFNAVGYFTQDNVNNLRLDSSDFIWDHDATALGAPVWSNATAYAPNAKVKFTHNWDHNKDGLVDEVETKLYFTYDGGTSSSVTGSIAEDYGVKWIPYDPVTASCQSNDILIITDGASTADYDGPAGRVTSFVNSNNDGVLNETWRAGTTEGTSYECRGLDGATVVSTLYGSTMLDDLTYYAGRNGASIYQGTYRTIGGQDKKGIDTHLVVTGTLRTPANPSLQCEPKTLLANAAANAQTVLHEASDAGQLEGVLRDIFESIGGEPASGSAASVISNSRSGEGAIYQAVFYPKQVDIADREIFWAGDVHALWLDNRGNIREDCGATGCASAQDATLVHEQDPILEFYTDANSSARARRYSDADGDGRYGAGDLIASNIKLNQLKYLWSAGEWLAQASPAQKASFTNTTKERYIFTAKDVGAALPVTVPFTATDLATSLAASYPRYFKAASAAEADKIVNYVRGAEQAGYRSRLIDWDGNGSTEIWKLGDIVHSTPTVVSQPAEDYDVIYKDRSYQTFRKHYQNRRTVVYAGGNDGGLHAFNGGYYDRATQKFEKGPPSKAAYDLGAEMWMFVPQNVWPHLKWLTDPKYSHVFYVDLKPYIFDAKVFAQEADCSTSPVGAGCVHPGGWGTILVAGMRFGGGDIGVDTDGDGLDDKTMRSAFFLLDISNPEAPPQVLGEFTDPDLGFTTAAPTAIPMLRCQLKIDCPTDPSATWHMDWYLAFGSGPHSSVLPSAAMNGNSDQMARLFLYPLGGTGQNLGYAGTFVPTVLQKTYLPADQDAANFNSYFSDIIAVDYDLNFKTDVLYFGSVENANQSEHRLHSGGVQRLAIGEDLNPANWKLTKFFETPTGQPVTAAPSVAWDGRRGWVYVGTGSYYSALLDKPVQAQQSFYGLKENYSSLGNLQLDQPNGRNLVDVSTVWVENGLGTLSATPTATISGATLTATTFGELNLEIGDKDGFGLDKYHGWKLDFDLPRERNLGQAAILGNNVTFTTYVPTTDLCRPEGESYLWAVYYRTGTGYTRSVIGTRARSGVEESLRKISIGAGMATTPNIHSGAEEGSKAFVQTSTGAIISIEQDNPGVIKSGTESWRELGN